MPELLLIGTAHRDLRGPERLAKLLDNYSPNKVCLETTPEIFQRAIRTHEIEMESLSRLPTSLFYISAELQRHRLIYSSGAFEAVTTQKYKQKNPSTDIIFIEKESSTKLVQDYAERVRSRTLDGSSKSRLLTPQLTLGINGFIKEGDPALLQKEIDIMYRENDPKLLIDEAGPSMFRRVMIERDAHFVSRIREIAGSHPRDKIAVILGNFHIFGNYGLNVFDQLMDLNPKRVMLPDADKL